MHSNRPTTSMRHRVRRSATIATAILVAISFPSGGVARTGPLGSPVFEPAPSIKPAADAVLDLFKLKPVVALGDDHGLQQEEAFYSELVRDPRFAGQVGNVVVEFGGSAAQDIIDRYVNGADVPFTELRHVWTDVVGWIPGPFALGYVNFFANVRAANMKLPPEHRIKVWLGDPQIDWTKINSFHDLEPMLSRRDDNIAAIIIDEILKKHQKALLIIGSAHLGRMESGSGVIPAPLVAKLNKGYPNALTVVSPFTGYIEPGCNARFVGWAKDWPVPAIVWPIDGTSLKSELQLPGCSYISPEQVERIKNVAQAGPRPGQGGPKLYASPAEIIAAANRQKSGVNSDAILYLGPPDTLTESPWEPSIYLDLDYFKETNRRAQCCVPIPTVLNWDEIVQQNSVLPRKFQSR